MKVASFLFFVLLLSCEKRHNLGRDIISIQEAEAIEKMLEEVPPNPNEFTIDVYLIDKNKNVCQTDFAKLKWLYKFSYKIKYTSLSSFFYNIVNQKIKLEPSETNIEALFSSPCPLSDTISELYQEKGIIGIIDKYCTVDNEKRSYILAQQKLSICDEQTISYYFFLNRYFKGTNDYANIISYAYHPQIKNNRY